MKIIDKELSSIKIDTTNGTSGTAFPIGTAGTPVDNIADARTMAYPLGYLRANYCPACNYTKHIKLKNKNAFKCENCNIVFITPLYF